MARLSVPANPIDEQILALQRQVASSQNEMEALREQIGAEKQIAEQDRAHLMSRMVLLAAENTSAMHDIHSLRVSNEYS